jgi:hypothetical protein
VPLAGLADLADRLPPPNRPVGAGHS